MSVDPHSAVKFKPRGLLKSSAGRNWSDLHAELRSHTTELLPGCLLSATEVIVVLEGFGTVTRQCDGRAQRTEAKPGAIWLCPAGLREEFVDISGEIPSAVHLFLPAQPFSLLERHFEVAVTGAPVLRYEAGFEDGLIRQIAQIVGDELESETSAGNVLIQTLTVSLAANLLGNHSETGPASTPRDEPGRGLDSRRLQRTLDYIETHIEDDVTLADLAAVANLSQFHFARSFKISTGKSPHRYLSDRRLSLAKSMIVRGECSLAEIALICNFSSQANFNRAFVRAVGLTPGQFRAKSAV